MRIDILTLFPEMFAGPLGTSIVGRAQDNGIVKIELWNIRDFTTDKHRQVDDYPFGGGAGMVMKPEPVFAAVRHVQSIVPGSQAPVIFLTPQGRTFHHSVAQKLAKEEHLIFLCGHYEGVDERIRQGVVTDEISIGDYVLTGGELPAMVVIDAVVRLLPGVLGDVESAASDSFANGLLEYPQYTRPRVFEGMPVPEVLLSGDHGRIRRWRRKEALRRTLLRRPDLIERQQLTEEDRQMLAEIRAEMSQEGRQKSNGCDSSS